MYFLLGCCPKCHSGDTFKSPGDLLHNMVPEPQPRPSDSVSGRKGPWALLKKF